MSETERGDVVVITQDGRRAERYAAVMVHMGRRPAGWLPVEEPTADELAALLTDADEWAAERGRWIGVVAEHVPSETVPSDAIIEAPRH